MRLLARVNRHVAAERVERLFADARPELVFHLAAEVGAPVINLRGFTLGQTHAITPQDIESYYNSNVQQYNTRIQQFPGSIIASGVLMGSFYPLVEMSRASEQGLGAYSVGFFFSGTEAQRWASAGWDATAG